MTDSRLNSESQLIHGTCIAYGAQAILLRGPSGAGKSDLALRCMMSEVSGVGSFGGSSGDSFSATAMPPKLVSDDQVLLRRAGERLLVSPPAAIAGKIEVRGLGILAVDWQAEADLLAVFDLVEPSCVERMPNLVARDKGGGGGSSGGGGGGDHDRAGGEAAALVGFFGIQVYRLAIAPFEASASLKLALTVRRLIELDRRI